MLQLPQGVIRIGILVLLGMTMVLSMVNTLEAEEAADGQRFGREVRREAPGLRSRLPFGLETVRTGNAALQADNPAVPHARSEAEHLLAPADGYARPRVNTAKGDVARFTALLAEYQKAPSVTRRRLSLETMRDILPAVQQVFVFDSDQPASLLPFLDLQRGNPLPGVPAQKEKQ